jgi:hypothetical protein
MNKIIFNNPRAALTIEYVGGRSLGRCYSESTYRVTSKSPLATSTIQAFRDANLVGIGQEFSCSQVILVDGRKVPVGDIQDHSGTDNVEAIEVEEWSGKPTGQPAVNAYTGKPYAAHSYGYYVYECVTRCDSGD